MTDDALADIANTLSRIKWQAEEAMKMLQRELERREAERIRARDIRMQKESAA